MDAIMILHELVRSFKRRFWVNILLMVQFSICLFLLITMLTYYLTIGESNEFGTVCKVNSRDWYMLRLETSDSMSEFSELAFAPDGLERVSELYGRLQNSQMFDLISAREWQNIYLETELMEKHLGEGNYEMLIDDCGGLIEHSQCYTEFEDEEGVHSVVSIKSVQMNYGAFEAFGLSTIEGQGLTKKNTLLESVENPVPVVLGNDYQGYFSVGEHFWFALPTIGTEDWTYQAVVVGILEKNSTMPVYGGIEAGVGEGVVNLDHMVVVANGLDIQKLPMVMKQKAKYASAIYADALNQSYISPRAGINYQAAVKEASEISREYGIDLYFTSVSFGMELLLLESEHAMAILLILTGAMTAFTIFCLMAVCISRIRDNTEIYAICMLNGADLRHIITPCLFEFLVLLLPALIVNYALLYSNMQMTRNYAPLYVVIIMAAGMFLLAACVIIRKVGGINIEELMRRKE